MAKHIMSYGIKPLMEKRYIKVKINGQVDAKKLETY